MRLIAEKEFFTATMIDTCSATLVETASQPSRYAGDVFPVKCERFEGVIAAPTQYTSMTMLRIRGMSRSDECIVAGEHVPRTLLPLHCVGISTEPSPQYNARFNIWRCPQCANSLAARFAPGSDLSAQSTLRTLPADSRQRTVASFRLHTVRRLASRRAACVI